MNCSMKQSCLNGQQKAAPENNLCEIQEQQTYTKYNQTVRKEIKHEPQRQTKGDKA